MALSGNQVTGLAPHGTPMRTSPLLRGVVEVILHLPPFFRLVKVAVENRIVKVAK